MAKHAISLLRSSSVASRNTIATSFSFSRDSCSNMLASFLDTLTAMKITVIHQMNGQKITKGNLFGNSFEVLSCVEICQVTIVNTGTIANTMVWYLEAVGNHWSEWLKTTFFMKENKFGHSC